MIQKILVVILLFFYTNSKAQLIRPEIGISGGASYYLGEINHSKQFYSVQPSFGILARNNFNNRYSGRIDLMRVTLSGNDADFKNNYQQTRLHTFTNNIYEASVRMECNFLPYNRNKYIFSPYVTGGVAALIMPLAKKKVTFAFPMGMGFKYATSEKMTIGAEWIFRSTATDYLDLLDDTNNTSGTPKQITSFNNNDWYVTAGIVISYSISGKKECAAYSTK